MTEKNAVASALYDEILNTLKHEKEKGNEVNQAGIVHTPALKSLAEAFATVAEHAPGKREKDEGSGIPNPPRRLR
ncbi:hypothetical protein I2485_01350 [Nesterenkonia sp. E16_7]|uniref:hypothetical protein n=1 Tax=unclassified Nesterenkonia TaxID=2629769 RepID=UPI001A930A7C|nr:MULTISPECIES: hypothetical protein [unclassified Nesterenkonia]MBO0594499.1 hypothetical protein [Nesterenkonia sp. E16_10]MBO0597293.1 hypothetical protein [Nesterenkonia sp. E16_7]